MRIPKEGELIGTVTEALGACRFRADCTDGKTRMVRIPGKFRNRVYIRAGYVVLLKPWDIEPEKADFVWSYRPADAKELKRRGML